MLTKDWEKLPGGAKRTAWFLAILALALPIGILVDRLVSPFFSVPFALAHLTSTIFGARFAKFRGQSAFVGAVTCLFLPVFGNFIVLNMRQIAGPTVEVETAQGTESRELRKLTSENTKTVRLLGRFAPVLILAWLGMFIYSALTEPEMWEAGSDPVAIVGGLAMVTLFVASIVAFIAAARKLVDLYTDGERLFVSRGRGEFIEVPARAGESISRALMGNNARVLHFKRDFGCGEKVYFLPVMRFAMFKDPVVEEIEGLLGLG